MELQACQDSLVEDQIKVINENFKEVYHKLQFAAKIIGALRFDLRNFRVFN